LLTAAAHLIVVLLLSGCGIQSSAGDAPANSTSSGPAATLVRRFNMGAGLESLANDNARTTTTFRMLVKRYGTRDAAQLVSEEIHKALPAYQPKWDSNLASIYAKHFSSEELRSLAAEGQRSPYRSQFAATHAEISVEMQKLSTSLLEQLVTEALTNAYREHPPKAIYPKTSPVKNQAELKT
jgi:hypothetical protein